MSAAAASSAAMVNGDNVVVDVSSSQGALSGAPVTDPSSTFVALKIAPRSRKVRKTNPIWIFFVAVHPSVTEYKPNSYVCLICRERKTNSVVCLGYIHNISPSGLSSYMHSNHREEYDEFLKSIAVKKKNPMRPVTPLITHHFTPKVDPKLVFKKRYAQWIVETSQPFTVSLVACVTDSASNMNKMGEYIIKKKVAHHYCADHIIQLTAKKAFSSGSVVCSLQKLKNLVNHVNKSPKINDRLRTCQVKCGFTVKLKLISDVKTRWWSTYDMISRALKVRIDY
jgi:hypothetical protein